MKTIHFTGRHTAIMSVDIEVKVEDILADRLDELNKIDKSGTGREFLGLLLDIVTEGGFDPTDEDFEVDYFKVIG